MRFTLTTGEYPKKQNSRQSKDPWQAVCAKVVDPRKVKS
jgi:hypothetical protein